RAAHPRRNLATDDLTAGAAGVPTDMARCQARGHVCFSPPTSPPAVPARRSVLNSRVPVPGTETRPRETALRWRDGAQLGRALGRAGRGDRARRGGRRPPLLAPPRLALEVAPRDDGRARRRGVLRSRRRRGL